MAVTVGYAKIWNSNIPFLPIQAIQAIRLGTMGQLDENKSLQNASKRI